MDKSPQPEKQSKQLNRLDSVYELQYETKGADDNYASSKDEAPPVSHYDDIYESVAHSTTECLKFLRSLKLEVIMFIYMFSYIMRSISSTTMIIEKVCIVHLGYPEDLCRDLEKNTTIKIQLEKMGNNYNVLHTMVQILPSAILSCFIGPWSDRYSRKIPIIVALVGIILDGFCAIASAAYKYSRVEYYVASGLFTSLSGGFISVLTVVYSCASDTTTPKNRTLKYALLELAFSMGIPLGSLAGGWIYKYSSYVYVFMTSVLGHCFGLLWVIFVMEETTGLDNKDPLSVKLRSFFKFESMKDSFKSVSKRRPHKARLQIWLLIFVMCIAVLGYAATGGISYLFTYHQYNWGNTKYSTVSAIFSILGMFGLITLVPLLTKVFKVSDSTLGIIGSASMIGKSITTSFASKEGLYYLAQLLGIFTGLSTMAGRSRISKIVPKSDLGKVFSFVSTSESLLPIAATVVFSQMFNASISMQFPGLVFLVIGLLVVINLGVFIFLAFLPAIDYDSLQEEEITYPEKDGELQMSS